jgi:TRAP-type C4-dicarboxylate transport system substrate-binding protein
VFLVVVLSGPIWAAGEDPIKLKFTNYNPGAAPLSKMFDRWAERVEKETNGRVQIKMYHSGSLVGYRDTYRGIQSGIADLGFSNLGGTAGVDPLNGFTSLPLMGWDSPYTAVKVYNELRKKFPKLDEEHESNGVKVLFTFMTPAQHLHFVDKTVRTPPDVKGVKVVSGPASMKIAQALGYVSVTKGPPDWYMSLQRGLAEGIFMHWPALDAFKLTELLNKHTMIGNTGINGVMAGGFINLKSWNKLPADIQKIISDLSPWISKELMDMDANAESGMIAQAKKNGHEVTYLSPKEIQQWIEATEPVRTGWVNDMEAQGLPGKALMQETKRLIQKFNQ